MKVTLIQQTDNPIEMLAKIASICYDSDPKSPLGLVKHLYRNGHHSVFEHVHFTFLIEGVSRACSHQLVRHRQCTFTQRSQRYCSEDGFEYVIPDGMEDSIVFVNAMEDARAGYAALVDAGESNEDARAVLPNACSTKLYMSCNLRELMHICNVRLCSRAQTEIRELVYAMRQAVSEELRWMLVPKCRAPYYNCLEKRTEMCVEAQKRCE